MKKIILQLLFIITIVMNSKSQTGVTSYSTPPDGTRYDLKIDATGNKWIAFKTVGLGKFNGSAWTMYDTTTSGIPANHVNGIAFDPSNNIWVATIKGLAKFDGTTWTTYNVINSALPDDSVSCVYVNGSDIWAGTRSGLAKFNGSTWTVYTTATSGLTTNLIKCVAVEASGDVWVGTRAGLFKKSGSTWSNFNSTNPYLVNTYNIYSICIDASNTKWVGATGTLGIGVYKLVGNDLLPLNTLYPLYGYLSSSLYGISKGPMGGVLFRSTSGLVEIVGSQLYRYSSIGCDYNVVDPTSGLIWMCWRLGAYPLYSFDRSSYPGSALLTPTLQPGYNTLDINMVNAGILDQGDMHWDLSNARYEVPKNSGRNAIFCSALWMGGLDNGGALHQAAMTYRQTGNDYWPGPLDTLSGTIDSTTSANYNKIWKVDRLKIEEFKYMYAIGAVTSGAYTVDNDILTWPTTGTGNISRKLAPFIDVNHDGIYNPLVDGDYPDIKGDQMCYWIFNDVLLPHTETGGAPLKVEVHASAYAYTCSTITDSLKVLNYTTFYNYEIFNRGTVNYHNTFLGIYQDGDLGSPSDDFVGCTPSDNYGSIYNGDSVDDNSPAGAIPYGLKPPMLSTVILNGPLAEEGDGIDNNNNGIIDEPGEKNLMTHFLYYNNDFSHTGNPAGATNYYDYMNSIWGDTTHATYGGTGYLGTTPYNFMFDGVPGGTGWDETSAGDVPADRRFLMSCGPFNLNAGAHTTFDYAIVYTRDTADVYSIGNLYQKNKEDVNRIKQWFAVDSFPSCLLLNVGIKEIPTDHNSISVYPNPTLENITVSYKIASKNASIKIYDATGRLVKNIGNIKTEENNINISELKNGLYLLTLQDGNNFLTQRFIKQ